MQDWLTWPTPLLRDWLVYCVLIIAKIFWLFILLASLSIFALVCNQFGFLNYLWDVSVTGQPSQQHKSGARRVWPALSMMLSSLNSVLLSDTAIRESSSTQDGARTLDFDNSVASVVLRLLPQLDRTLVTVEWENICSVVVQMLNDDSPLVQLIFHLLLQGSVFPSQSSLYSRRMDYIVLVLNHLHISPPDVN